MAEVSGSRTSEWTTFTFRGRPFLRSTLTETNPDVDEFSIAQTVASRYRVEGLFALSETSLLVRAIDLRTQRPVLLKSLRTEPIGDFLRRGEFSPEMAAELRRRRHQLQTERRLLVRLRNAGCTSVPHPNDYIYDLNPALECPPSVSLAEEHRAIVEGLVAAEPYLVMGLLAGRSLEERIHEDFPAGMPEALALAIIRPIIEAIRILQVPWRLKSGRTWHCVYQDLKPANILIDPLGRATLLDLGGCQVIVDGVPVLEGACTRGYSPPECEGPPRVLLPCADVYCIGTTLYHMLTGIDPREGLDPDGRRPVGRIDPGKLPRHCSPQLRRLIERCLAPRPSDRIADAEQVAHILSPLVTS
jgi:serine/threonine protein kinase